MSQEAVPLYAPPPGPPPNHPQLGNAFIAPSQSHWNSLPLLPAHFPLLSPAQVHTLTTQGYTTFPISQRLDLHDAALALFDVSRAFFAQSQADKAQFRVVTHNTQGSEEGWSRVIGEKELLTLRRGGTCPPAIESQGSTLWRECGALLREVIHGVEQSLGMRQGALDDVVVPECAMPGDGADRLETLLRMFRYERRSEQDNSSTAHSGETSIRGKGRLVAEPHRDLGLLSLVIGASPGLEVLDTTAGGWLPIEQPPYACPGALTATLLVGETLTRLTNGRYVPGRHRVFVPPIPPLSSAEDEAQFRYSLVFALRPHAKAMISTSALMTPMTGPFQHPLEGVPARMLFSGIARSHWNVNAGHEHRQAQRSRLHDNSHKAPSFANGSPETHHDQCDDQQLDGERSADRVQTVSQSLTQKRQRWSLSIFNTSRAPPEGERAPRRRWLTFKRLSR